jgi:hypothetical protein
MKILKILLPVLLMTQIILTAQNLDSLYSSFLELNSYSGKFKNLPEIESYKNIDKSYKCGFSLISDVKRNFENFTEEQRNVMQPMFSRFNLSNNIATPGGYFRIHYDAQGSNAPAYDINLLAQALDSTYNFEIVKLGYPIPPSDGIEGGDDKYDIYIINIPYYGYTTPENSIGNKKSTSYITIDNDFMGSSFATHGIDGARVTVAHEFHHAIQIGAYKDDPQGDQFYYEITSTAFEEFVFDDINDYYSYNHSYFNNPGRTFGRFSAGNDGYDLATWNIFLQKKYGYDIIKRTWEFIAGQRAIRSIDNALSEEGSSFKKDYNEFGEWTYFTNHRADTTLPYFDEAKFYPSIEPMVKILYLPPSDEITISSNAASNNFIQFVDESQSRSDTLFAIITNADIQGSFNSSDPTKTNFTFELSSDISNGSIKVTDNYFYNTNLSSTKPLLFEQNIILNYKPSKIPNPPEIAYAYPQPFNYNTHSKIDIPASANDDNTNAELYVFSANMELVFSDNLKVEDSELDLPAVKWNAKTDDGSKIPSGIYFYLTKRGSEIKKGKLAIFND